MEFSISELRARLEETPEGAGCYIFKAGATPLYVGKAKSLRKRLVSYLGTRPVGDPKTQAMLERATTVELILTVNETEALLLEMTLITKHRPKYNVTLHDFPYIKITKETYPRIYVTREPPDETTGRYIGPLTDASAVRRTVEVTNRAFKLRACRYNLDARPPRRACLDRETGICDAPCIGDVSPETYAAVVQTAIQFITGRRAGVFHEFEKRMRVASAALRYEDAAAWRDVMKGLERAVAGQAAVVRRKTNADAIACDVRGERLYAVVVKVREGCVLDRVCVKTGAPVGDPVEEFTLGYYGAGAEIPPRVLVSRSFGGRLAVAATLTALRGGRVEVTAPRRREGAEVLKVAVQNLAYFIETDEVTEARRGELESVFEEISAAAALPFSFKYCEMMDVSHTGGRETVGALVAFREGVADKNSYRRFRVRTVPGPDDYAAFAELTRRRFKGAEAGTLPDLFLVDGGKGQLAAAAAALRETGFPDQPVAAVAKDPDRLYVLGHEDASTLSPKALLFLGRVRDEAHRFAVTYHRSVRGRGVRKSVLDEVRGVGLARKKALLKAFGSVEKIAQATAAEIGEVGGVPAPTARAVYDYLHGGDDKR